MHERKLWSAASRRELQEVATIPIANHDDHKSVMKAVRPNYAGIIHSLHGLLCDVAYFLMSWLIKLFAGKGCITEQQLSSCGESILESEEEKPLIVPLQGDSHRYSSIIKQRNNSKMNKKDASKQKKKSLHMKTWLWLQEKKAMSS